MFPADVQILSTQELNCCRAVPADPVDAKVPCMSSSSAEHMWVFIRSTSGGHTCSRELQHSTDRYSLHGPGRDTIP
jgi:hypothetical protein